MENSSKKLTKKDLRKTFFRYYTFCELGSNYERMQSIPFAASISYCLERLYSTKQDKISAMERHLQFFNTEGTFGSMILGATVSMEEQKSVGVPLPSETITGLKTGLMGPVAGIGDTLIWGTLKTILASLALTLALQGNYLSVFIELVFPIVTYILAYNLFFSGYKLGTKSIKNIMKGGLLNQLIDASSAMGLFMMGALSSSYVTFELVTKIKMPKADPIILQKMLDDIIPGLLPLLAIFAIYFYLKKKNNYIAVVISVLLLSLVGSFFGIL